MLHHKRFSANVLRAFLSTLIMLAAMLLASPGSAPAADQKVFVLCYHSFLGNKFPTDIPMNEFRSQMDFLKSKGFKFVSYADLMKGTVTGTQNILLIIDDGNHSVQQAYQEVMKPLGIKPMLAIYPNIISKKSYALTWEQLNELRKEGCDIAAHGYYHELMNQKFYDRDNKEFIHEIMGSKETLEKMIPGVKVSAFVYPNGVRADITKKILRESGYSSAFTIQWGAALSPLSGNKDPLELPRYMVQKGNWKMISSAILKASAG
jgi:peptidoglycan/xylan/chitin deacetylase (PgdA/CDA1 family)